MKASYIATICGSFIVAAGLALTSGCSSDGHPTLLPNADSNLRKSSTEFAADAAKRSYETSAPKGNQTIARAQFNLMERQFDVANLTNSDWQNVEVWVNQKYVVAVPTFSKNSGKALNFELFYDNEGHHFSTNWGSTPVKTLEIYADGKMYPILATLQ